MKTLVVLAVVLSAFGVVRSESCYKDAVRACTVLPDKKAIDVPNCNAKYGAIDIVSRALQAYVTSHVVHSYNFLLMSTHYANYQKNRLGFEKLYRSLSDTAWHDAIKLIKEITKRGGDIEFIMPQSTVSEVNLELYEMESMAKALDIEKELAVEAFNIHDEVSHKRKDHHDPEIASFLEEEFVHKHAKTIRELTGHTVDLKKILSSNDASLGLYLFDEYLQKL